LELWYGFIQSAILGWKPFVTIDVAHKGFPAARNAVDIIMDICKLGGPEDLHRELSVWQKADFLAYIRGLKIEYMLPNVSSNKKYVRTHGIL
jgi:eukaryotic translation initiation factor 2C